MIPYDSGFLSKQLVAKDSRYKKYLSFYKGIFGEDLYVEEQPHKRHLELSV
jgi:hypothetical protein